jgi:hypothetical protein
MRIFCLSLSVLAGLLCPIAAAAKILPPGNSGADQYAETLPGAGGNQPINPQPTNPGGAGGGRSPSEAGGGRSLAASGAPTQKRLDELGPSGRAPAALTHSVSPRGQQQSASGKYKQGRATTAESPSGSSGFVDVFKQLGGGGDSGGMGIALPLILAGSLLAAIVRLRRRS